MMTDAHIHFSSFDRYDELLRYCSALEIERAGLVSLPDLDAVNFNPELILAKTLAPDRFYAFGAVERDSSVPALAVQRLHDIGFDGLKFITGKPAFAKKMGLSLESKEIGEAFEAAAQLGMPAVVHVGDPREFWLRGEKIDQDGNTARTAAWTYGADSPAFKDCLALAERLVEAHPATIFIFPHLLFLAHDLERLGRLLSRRPGIYSDLAPGKYFFAELADRRREAEEFFGDFRDKIFLGSDALFFDPSYRELEHSDLYLNIERLCRLRTFLESEECFPNPFAASFARMPVIRGLGLAGEITGELFGGSFRGLMKEKPAPIATSEAREYLADFSRALPVTGEAANTARRKRIAELAAGRTTW
jgi:hypothetical protein